MQDRLSCCETVFLFAVVYGTSTKKKAGQPAFPKIERDMLALIRTLFRVRKETLARSQNHDHLAAFEHRFRFDFRHIDHFRFHTV